MIAKIESSVKEELLNVKNQTGKFPSRLKIGFDNLIEDKYIEVLINVMDKEYKETYDKYSL